MATNFEEITKSPEVLGAFLASLPYLEGPWDTEFQRNFCAGCGQVTCDPICRYQRFRNIVMNGGLDRDTVEELWRKRKRKGQKKGDRIGFCNADRLQADENGIAALCVYLVKQSGGKKRWTSSQNLERPTSRTNDGKYNRRQIEKWARERPGREFWEKKYPGWTLTDEDYGIEYKYNDFTGWSIYLKLRKKE